MRRPRMSAAAAARLLLPPPPLLVKRDAGGCAWWGLHGGWLAGVCASSRARRAVDAGAEKDEGAHGRRAPISNGERRICRPAVFALVLLVASSHFARTLSPARWSSGGGGGSGSSGVRLVWSVCRARTLDGARRGPRPEKLLRAGVFACAPIADWLGRALRSGGSSGRCVCMGGGVSRRARRRQSVARGFVSRSLTLASAERICAARAPLVAGGLRGGPLTRLWFCGPHCPTTAPVPHRSRPSSPGARRRDSRDIT
jgi:hypothetical protein